MVSRLALVDGVSLVLLVNGTDHILLAASDASVQVEYAAFTGPPRDGPIIQIMTEY